MHIYICIYIYAYIYIYIDTFFFPMALWSNAGHGLLIHEVYRSHTTTHHSRYGSSRRVISSSQRPLPDNTQHSQQTNVHATGGIRTHDLSRRAATDLNLRPRLLGSASIHTHTQTHTHTHTHIYIYNYITNSPT